VLGVGVEFLGSSFRILGLGVRVEGLGLRCRMHQQGAVNLERGGWVVLFR